MADPERSEGIQKIFLLRTIMYFVYFLQCNDGSIYTGITNDIARRFDQHKKGFGASYTRSKGAMKILYTEEHSNKGAALKREAEIKSWTRQKKLNLIQFGRPQV